MPRKIVDFSARSEISVPVDLRAAEIGPDEDFILIIELGNTAHEESAPFVSNARIRGKGRG